jgi:hypothetical protein
VSDEAGVLVEVAVERDGALSAGLRVHRDGRAESVADGRWTPAWTYPQEAVAALAASAAEADDPPLAAEYSRPGGVSHPTTVRWRLPSGREITIERFSEGLVPALDRLYERLFQLRPDPAASSLWRVRTGEGTVQRRVECEPAAIPELGPLVDALFAREAPGDVGAPASAESEAPVLVEVLWETAGRPAERTIVRTDGTWVEIDGATREPQRTASADELQALREAIDGIDWDSLPDPIPCPE